MRVAGRSLADFRRRAGKGRGHGPVRAVSELEENLNEAKNEVKDTRQTLANVVSLLGDRVPTSPKFDPADPSTFPLFK